MSQIYEAETVVDENGCIKPTFHIPSHSPNHERRFLAYTSGFLKYFGIFKGKRVKVTIEILED